jgi:trehalose-6-phosphate synthase
LIQHDSGSIVTVRDKVGITVVDLFVTSPATLRKMQQMKSKNKDIVSRMDNLFERLDAAKLAPVTVLNSDAQKEHYETLLMFAYRKY